VGMAVNVVGFTRGVLVASVAGANLAGHTDGVHVVAGLPGVAGVAAPALPVRELGERDAVEGTSGGLIGGAGSGGCSGVECRGRVRG
jgi:hypothetical protein